jgi:hypothetical protein
MAMLEGAALEHLANSFSSAPFHTRRVSAIFHSSWCLAVWAFTAARTIRRAIGNEPGASISVRIQSVLNKEITRWCFASSRLQRWLLH